MFQFLTSSGAILWFNCRLFIAFNFLAGYIGTRPADLSFCAGRAVIRLDV